LNCAGKARICPSPSRREVMLTTAMVFVMAALTALFFFLVDLLIRTGLQGLLGLFG